MLVEAHYHQDSSYSDSPSLRTALLERLIQSVHNRQRGGDWIIEQLERTISGWEGSGKSGGADLVKLVKHSSALAVLNKDN